MENAKIYFEEKAGFPPYKHISIDTISAVAIIADYGQEILKRYVEWYNDNHGYLAVINDRYIDLFLFSENS